jgi:predicted DNA-binding protein
MIQKKLMALRIDKNVRERLKINSIKVNRTMSEIVTELIEKYLKEQENGNKGTHEKE